MISFQPKFPGNVEGRVSSRRMVSKMLRIGAVKFAIEMPGVSQRLVVNRFVHIVIGLILEDNNQLVFYQ